MSLRKTHKPGWIWACLAISLLAHPGAALLYEATRETPRPRLLVEVAGDGTGVVLSSPTGIHCGADCSLQLEPGSIVKLRATVGENSTFEGWDGPCGSQAHRLTQRSRAWLVDRELPSSVDAFLNTFSERPLDEHPLECEVSLVQSVEIRARFGVPPETVDVETLVASAPLDPEEVTVTLPKVRALPEELMEIPEEILEEEEPEEKTPPPVPLPTPEEVAAAETPPPPKVIEVPKMKAVEVADENEVKDAPEDARFLSDKNRNVEEETVAKETNLDKQSEGEVIASAESTLESEEIGGEEAEIAQLDDMEETALSADRENDTSTGSESGEVVVKPGGEDGQGGDDGKGGDDSPTETPGLLSMRNITGRGALGTSGEPVDPEDSEQGTGGDRGRPGKKGRAGPKLRLEQEDYERIVGKEVADKEMAVAQRKKSRRRGRWERKMGMLKSTLENFTPEVRTGNQTALKTRAAPFAVYIARMHRRIHELWGFGFLEDLDSKSSSHELNNWELWVKLEIVINPDGEIDKMTIVRPSGLLTFDVAALDVVDTAGPYEATPKAIRSPDGKVYMHWSFHRDWRQCGTFGAEPFILASPPGNRDGGMDDSQLLRGRPKVKKQPESSSSRKTSSEAAAGASARATANLASPDDPAAQHLANLWLSAFVAGRSDKLASLAAVPFRSGTSFVARSKSEVQDVFKEVIRESKSRRVSDWSLLSAAGYRRAAGPLPEGIAATGKELYMLVKLNKQSFTLVVEKRGEKYAVTGLSR